MKTHQEKKIRRKIAKASKRGRYVVGRKGSRARPGRKKGYLCNFCNNTLPVFSDDSICTTCRAKRATHRTLDHEKRKAIMNIPAMSKK